jgi:hypothetical protein
VESDLVSDPAARTLLDDGFPLDEEYRGRDPDRLVHRQGLYVMVRTNG